MGMCGCDGNDRFDMSRVLSLSLQRQYMCERVGRLSSLFSLSCSLPSLLRWTVRFVSVALPCSFCSSYCSVLYQSEPSSSPVFAAHCVQLHFHCIQSKQLEHLLILGAIPVCLWRLCSFVLLVPNNPSLLLTLFAEWGPALLRWYLHHRLSFLYKHYFLPLLTTVYVSLWSL